MSTIHWPADEWKRAKELLGRGFSVAVVAHRLSKKASSLRDKIRWESLTPAQRESRRMRINAQRQSKVREELLQPEARYQPERITVEKAPAHVFEERARRQAIQRSPIEELLGVPPAGYSALDRKLAGLGA